jgi:hypothetical protein
MRKQNIRKGIELSTSDLINLTHFTKVTLRQSLLEDLRKPPSDILGRLEQELEELKSLQFY